MAVKFGSDGTLYCNTIRYNYKQARNIIADGSYGNISGCWVFNNATYTNTPYGYKSYRCFKFNPNGTSMITQNAPTPIAGHKYYGGCMYNTSIGYTSADSRFEWYLTDGNNNVNLTFGFKDKCTNGNWVKLSNIVEAGTAPSNGQWIIRNFVVNGTTDCLCSRMILIDLTDTFGEGNEPNKEWCDNNIREWETIINFGNISGNINTTNIDSRFSFSSLKANGNFNYLSLNSGWEPREYMCLMVGDMDKVEGYCYSQAEYAIDNTSTYYAYIEYHKPLKDYNAKQGIDFYIPVAEPSLGRCNIVKNNEFNGGGGMCEWKRASAYNKRTEFEPSNYQMRIDFNNRNDNNDFRITAINLMKVESSVLEYNRNYNTSIKVSDVNKEWCDRWIDGRSSPIIHIKDHTKKTISFNTNYDIVCNDIEIRPELDSVKFDAATGTIYCKKLVKQTDY